MYKFNFITSSTDGKMTATVSSDFISHQLLSRSINTVVTADNGTGIGFTLSDGAHIKFRLKPDTAEVIYYSPKEK